MRKKIKNIREKYVMENNFCIHKKNQLLYTTLSSGKFLLILFYKLDKNLINSVFRKRHNKRRSPTNNVLSFQILLALDDNLVDFVILICYFGSGNKINKKLTYFLTIRIKKS